MPVCIVASSVSFLGWTLWRQNVHGRCPPTSIVVVERSLSFGIPNRSARARAISEQTRVRRQVQAARMRTRSSKSALLQVATGTLEFLRFETDFFPVGPSLRHLKETEFRKSAFMRRFLSQTCMSVHICSSPGYQDRDFTQVSARFKIFAHSAGARNA